MNISATAMAATLLWVAGGALIVLGLVYDHHLNGLGLWLSGLGGVMSIRRMLCQQYARERNAFELGKDYADHVSHIRPL